MCVPAIVLLGNFNAPMRNNSKPERGMNGRNSLTNLKLSGVLLDFNAGQSLFVTYPMFEHEGHHKSWLLILLHLFFILKITHIIYKLTSKEHLGNSQLKEELALPLHPSRPLELNHHNPEPSSVVMSSRRWLIERSGGFRGAGFASFKGWENVSGIPHREETLGQAHELLQRLYLLAGLGMPGFSLDLSMWRDKRRSEDPWSNSCSCSLMGPPVSL